MRNVREILAGLFVLLCVGVWVYGAWTKLVPLLLASGS
jgi:hypothetical protein